MAKVQDCILIIEDDRDQAVIISETFKRSSPGILIATAEEKTSALAFLADFVDSGAYSPKLILLDLYMPHRKNGLDLLVSMHDFFKKQGMAGIPVVMLTHSRDLKDIKVCYELGANAYMVKPSSYDGWLELCKILYKYWFETVTLPKKLY